ncbi:MAG: hypothetical protein HCA25_20440 [Dolichospermum sp. DET50]|nr:hypothetical protein [Dolichospermum sp. DET66]MBS3034565.1 hypothetical protein [Dolichospermum sp. DET67]MBS3039768.1 hypothetical protein [Dolichospermum sp. DET50]QSX66967.1 MAG: hypothetical protein EZY12_19710 [Dolichospermum sp. DET69]
MINSLAWIIELSFLAMISFIVATPIGKDAISSGRVEGGYYPALLSVKSGRATFTAPSFRCS